MTEGGFEAVRTDKGMVAASCIRELAAKVAELERLPVGDTTETGILRKSLEAHSQKQALLLRSPPRGGAGEAARARTGSGAGSRPAYDVIPPHPALPRRLRRIPPAGDGGECALEGNQNRR